MESKTESKNEAPNIKEPKLILYQGEVFEQFKRFPWNGWKKHELIPKGEPCISYDGPRIPMDEWAKAISFMRWACVEKKSEAQLRIFANFKDYIIRLWAFPQEGVGMTTVEIGEENKKMNEIRKAQRAMFGKEWIVFGTIHSHMNSSAFQSSTDKHNEDTQEGMHFTVGYIEKNELDLHGRVVISGVTYTVQNWLSWFDVGVDMDFLPECTQSEVAKKIVAAPFVSDFPVEWKNNFVEKKFPKVESVGSVGFNQRALPGVYKDHGNGGGNGGSGGARTFSDRHNVASDEKQEMYGIIDYLVVREKYERHAIINLFNQEKTRDTLIMEFVPPIKHFYAGTQYEWDQADAEILIGAYVKHMEKLEDEVRPSYGFGS